MDKNILYVNWDARTEGDWIEQMEGSDVIINLVGKSVNCRYTERNKKEIIDSRVNATLALVMPLRNLSSRQKFRLMLALQQFSEIQEMLSKMNMLKREKAFHPGCVNNGKLHLTALRYPVHEKSF